MPPRFYKHKTDGVVANFKIKKEAYEKAKKYYYVLMGWDNEGVPLPEKIEELDIA